MHAGCWPVTWSLSPLTSILRKILPLRSVWSVPHRLGTFITHCLWTFMSQAENKKRNICKHYRIRHNNVNKDIHNPVSFHSLFNRTGQYVNRAWFRAATNDYFDNRLVGRLFFRLIRWNKIIFFYWQNTHYSTFFSMPFKLIECYENIVFNLLNHLS